MSKQFVKAKPLNEAKEKPPNPRENRKNNGKKYEEKVYQPKDNRDHIKQMLNGFQKAKPNPIVTELCRKFPKFFTDNSRKPEPEKDDNFNDVLWLGPKKQYPPRQVKQMSSDSSEPNWESDEEKEVKLVSKKIDTKIIEKVATNLSGKHQKKEHQLQRHQKQFLEDYYKNKKNLEIEIQARIEERKGMSQVQTDAKQESDKQIENEPSKINTELWKAEKKEKSAVVEEDWAEYNPKVNALIHGGFIQKVEKDDEEEDFSMEDDFSVEEEGEQREPPSQSSSSSEDDDDMLTDDGPRTVIQKKASTVQTKPESRCFVKISSHMFTQMAEEVGINPQACTWVISNKQVRYKVSTQYMDEIYVSQELHVMFPYISLNHSEFVHYEEIESERAMQKFRKFNQRKRYNVVQSKTKKNNVTPNNGGIVKKVIQYKPRK